MGDRENSEQPESHDRGRRQAVDVGAGIAASSCGGTRIVAATDDPWIALGAFLDAAFGALGGGR